MKHYRLTRSAALSAASRAVSLNGLNRHSTAPRSSRRGRDADQIVDAAPKARDLFSGLFGLRFHTHTTVGAVYVARRPRSSHRNSSGGTKNGFWRRLPPILDSRTFCKVLEDASMRRLPATVHHPLVSVSGPTAPSRCLNNQSSAPRNNSLHKTRRLPGRLIPGYERNPAD